MTKACTIMCTRSRCYLSYPTVASHAVACLTEHTHRARASQLPPMGVIARTAEVHHVAYVLYLDSYHHVHSLPLLPQPTVASHAVACGLTEHTHRAPPNCHLWE